MRRVIEHIYFRPSEGRERVFIFTDSAFMKEAANSLLKILEEPPEYATIFLLAENAGELLPTIRSRCMVLPLRCLSTEEIEQYLTNQRPEWKPAQRALVARLSEGAVGRARSFDLAGYQQAREHALTILRTALRASDHSDLFKDLLFLDSGSPQLVRNTDITGELQKLAQSANFEWLTTASERLGDVERGMRRNLLRSLSLDAFEAALERS